MSARQLRENWSKNEMRKNLPIPSAVVRACVTYPPLPAKGRDYIVAYWGYRYKHFYARGWGLLYNFLKKYSSYINIIIIIQPQRSERSSVQNGIENAAIGGYGKQ